MKTKLLITATTILFFLNNSVLAQSPASPANELRAKVEKRVEETINIPFARIGTVTDISNETLQINQLNGSQEISTGEIQLVSIGAQTTFANNVSKKAMEASDLAIGDFIIAMGYLSNGDVLNAQRIVVTEVIKPSVRRSYYLVVVLIEDETAVKDLKGNQFTLKTEKGVTVTSESDNPTAKDEADLTEGQSLVAVGTATDEVLTARSLYLIGSAPPSPTPVISPTPLAE